MSSNRGALWCAVLGAAVFATPALADSQRVKFHNSFGTTGGGEFRIEMIDWDLEPVSLPLAQNGANDRFEAFCVERDEFVSYGTTFHVDFSNAAIDGGVGGPSPDPISDETRYLYREFITGSLASYNYGSGSSRVSSANALQRVIWWLEDEYGVGAPQPWSAGSLEATFYSDAATNAASASGLGEVMVMNVFGNSSHTANKQDQLVMFTPIPAPGAAVLGMIGIGSIGWIRRKFA